MSAHGLAEVAQLDAYKGFVFATLDPTAPPLAEYLGPTGRLGLDLIAEKGDDMQAVPGVQKFVIGCNWKIAVDNLFDWYHPQVTHALGDGPRRRGDGSSAPPERVGSSLVSARSLIPFERLEDGAVVVASGRRRAQQLGV